MFYNKKIFLFLLVFLAHFSVYGAATRCIYKPYSCSTPSSSISNVSDTTINCSGQSVTVMGMCANQLGASGTGEAANQLYISVSNVELSKYCWCKMLKPVASKWIYLSERTNASDCISYCTSACAMEMVFNSSFLDTMFTKLQ